MIRNFFLASLVAVAAIMMVPLTAAVAVDYQGMPHSATVVAGNPVEFSAFGKNMGSPDADGNNFKAQWYRNGVAISAATNPSATTTSLKFIADISDNGALYHVIESGYGKNANGDTVQMGPTASPKATLTVLPAGTSYPAKILSPPATEILKIPSGDVLAGTYKDNFPTFVAQGNDLLWEYRYSNEPVGAWTSYGKAGLLVDRLWITPPKPAPVTTIFTMRVTDNKGVSDSRTWSINLTNTPPRAIGNIQLLTPYFVVFVGQTLKVDAAHGLANYFVDDNGDTLTYKMSGSAPGLTVNADGSFSFTCPSNASTRDGIVSAGMVVANDGKVESPATSLSISVLTGPGDINRDGGVTNADVGMVRDHLGESATFPK